MILSDQSIRTMVENGKLGVYPFDASHLQPASLDVRLSDNFRQIVGDPDEPIDPKVITDTRPFSAYWYNIEPGEFLLGSTIERFEMPNNLVGRLEGRSTYGRLGLLVHITAGYIDPGFHGNITLEFFNAGPRPIRLEHGAFIGQVTFHLMTTESNVPYGTYGLGSKYQGQSGATAASPNWK